MTREDIKPRFDLTITMGDIVTAVGAIIGGGIVAVAWVLNSGHATTDLTASQVRIEAQLVTQNATIQDLSNKVAALPVDRVIVNALAQKVERIDADNRDQSMRINAVDRAGVAMQGQIDTLKGTVSNIALRPR